MRVIYNSVPGGKPMRIGMNHAKRIAHRSDKIDQRKVQRELGAGLPRQHLHHQRLVKQRHAYYKDVYEEEVRARTKAREDAAAKAASAADVAADDVGGAVPEPEGGPVTG